MIVSFVCGTQDRKIQCVILIAKGIDVCFMKYLKTNADIRWEYALYNHILLVLMSLLQEGLI